jgi:hypothetical protein
MTTNRQFADLSASDHELYRCQQLGNRSKQGSFPAMWHGPKRNLACTSASNSASGHRKYIPVTTQTCFENRAHFAALGDSFSGVKIGVSNQQISDG